MCRMRGHATNPGLFSRPMDAITMFSCPDSSSTSPCSLRSSGSDLSSTRVADALAVSRKGQKKEPVESARLGDRYGDAAKLPK